MNELSKRLRDKRGKSGHKLMGDAIGISASFYRHIEDGTRIPNPNGKRPQDVEAIASLLNVTTDHIYAWTGRMPPDLIEFVSGDLSAIKRLRKWKEKSIDAQH